MGAARDQGAALPAVNIQRGAAGRGRIDYKWMVLSVTTLGALLAAIDSSIVILALPSIMTDLSTNLVTAIWVLIGYILMYTPWARITIVKLSPEILLHHPQCLRVPWIRSGAV